MASLAALNSFTKFKMLNYVGHAMFSSKVVNKLEINGQTTGSIRVCLCKQEVMILINMVVFYIVELL